MEGNEEEEEEEGFLDYTTSTAWESFCAEIEAKLRSWKERADAHCGTSTSTLSRSSTHGTTVTEAENGQAIDQAIVSVLESKLPQFRPENYSLALHRPPEGHYLADWLGLGTRGRPFALLYPNSFSGCVLDREESVALLSAHFTSAANSHFAHPLLIPVRDRQRRSFDGVLLREKGHLARLQTDCVTGILKASEMHPLAVALGYHEEAAMGSGPGAAGAAGDALADVTRVLELAWTPPESESDMSEIWVNDWNAACPWYPWAEYEDPVASVRIELRWEDTGIEDVRADLEAFQSSRACVASRAGGGSNTFPLASLAGGSRFATSASLSLELDDAAVSDGMWRGSPPRRPRAGGGHLFSSMVAAFHANFQVAERAKGVSQLVQESFWDDRGELPAVPPEKLLRSQSDSVFNRRSHVTRNFGGLENDLHCLPTDDLLGYLSMYALSYGDNPRAVALLWRRFVSEVRLRHWEEGVPLPRMAAANSFKIDHGKHVIEQKLQLIQLCILGLSSCGAPADATVANPSMLTSDQVAEFDFMFTATANKRSRSDVWAKMHGAAAVGLASSLRKANPKAGFGDFKAAFRSSAYFVEMSKICESLPWNGFTKDRLRESWSRSAWIEPGGDTSSGEEFHDCEEGEEGEGGVAALHSRAEMALDWLEHVPPVELFRSLYSIGLRNAIGTLEASRNARLAPLADLLSAVKSRTQDWLARLPQKLATSDLETDEEAAALCVNLGAIELSLSFAESVAQKLWFLPLGARSDLVREFASKLASRAFSAGAFLDLRLSGPARDHFVALEEGEGLELGGHALLLHLRRQVLRLSSGPRGGDGGGAWFYSYLCQDLDRALTRYASVVTV